MRARILQASAFCVAQLAVSLCVAQETLEIETVVLVPGESTASLAIRATTSSGPIESFAISLAFDPTSIRVQNLVPSGAWLAAGAPDLVAASGTNDHPGKPGEAALFVLLDINFVNGKKTIPQAPSGDLQEIARVEVELVAGPGGELPALPVLLTLEDGAHLLSQSPPVTNSLVIAGQDYVAASAGFVLALIPGGLTGIPPVAKLRRGDSNSNGAVDISDAVFTLNFLFLGGAAIACLDAADANDDGKVDLSDAVWTLGYLFLGGAPPPPPGANACGIDPTEDLLPECEEAEGCG